MKRTVQRQSVIIRVKLSDISEPILIDKGKIIGSWKINVNGGKLYLFEDRLFILDIYREKVIYEYKIDFT